MTLVVHPPFSKYASARLLKLCSKTRVITSTAERQTEHLDAIGHELAQGADPNAQDRTINRFTTPLNAACNWGHTEAVALLLSAGAQLVWGPERSLPPNVLTDEDEVYGGQPLDALGVAMEALSWDLAHYSRVAQRRLPRVQAIALMLLDAGADPYLPDAGLETTPAESFFRYLDNDGLSSQAPAEFMTDLLERMLSMGPDATKRLRHVAQRHWQSLDYGWRSLKDFEVFGEALCLKARKALLHKALPPLSHAPKVRL